MDGQDGTKPCGLLTLQFEGSTESLLRQGDEGQAPRRGYKGPSAARTALTERGYSGREGPRKPAILRNEAKLKMRKCTGMYRNISTL